ncbi:KdsC family phosphatase [Lysinibacillus boronitolerans]|uniref:3-deoxy-D-manno-octulosonate 8-phosphate phosphatase n=1 Tax=Lysinibacillus boronitolerans JCM 21713 = 10a = NBRC 103108 TaxID=1294264 RepID=A0ABR4Y140_9BACI|nr:HAD hydrolase family protein [Lysinibacillus boronitolerans]KGR86927.1 hypothetical protein CD31_08585 [Lysinibacillus boronitolerans JCM 21713 = 10a = NBRC 103108]
MDKNAIKLVVFDVDGTLTDGKVYFGVQGEELKVFNVKDGLRIKQLNHLGVKPIVITGRYSDILNIRMKELGIDEVFQNINNKKEILQSIVEKYELVYGNIAYIGDDENDLECIKLCAITGCPSDAAPLVKKSVDFISSFKGGEGAVREFLDFLLEDKIN